MSIGESEKDLAFRTRRDGIEMVVSNACTGGRCASQRVPIVRMLGNKDIQGAVLFLASDASKYVTGANLMVDGGWSAL